MDIRITVKRRDINRLFLLLIAFSIALIAAFLIDYWLGHPIWLIERLVDIDDENSIPAWFSSIQLFMIGLFLLLKGWKTEPGPGPARWFFMLGAAGFIFLAADEALFIHESITEALSKYPQLFRFSGGHGMWIPFYLGTIAVLLLLTLPQVIRFWKFERRGFLTMAAGAAVFLSGAVGLEILAYEFLEAGSALWLAEVAAEEFLEMLGNSIMIYGSLEMLADRESQPTAVTAAGEPPYSEAA